MGGFLSHLNPENNPEVLEASCGPIRGNIYKHDEKIVAGYLGIPFAKPPIGDLRFQKPVAAEKWTEPRDCYKYGPGCPQSGHMIASLLPPGYRQFSEKDCLNLNVFVPRWKSDKFPNGFPVMVYFHGGGFEIGFSSFVDDYSLSGTLPLKDVIVVTANYRLGPLGFLTTGDDVAKGNYGLWDQTEALKWVQKHITSFGGDPNKVTVCGSSAGAISADLLALSPHSNKLFHRFMAMSGTAYCLSAIRSKADEAMIFRDFAKFSGYDREDSRSLFEWYNSQELSMFQQSAGFQKKVSGIMTSGPNLDGDFFPKPLDQLRKEAPQLDAMITVNEFEGLGMLMLFAHRRNDMTIIEEIYGADILENPKEIHRKLYDFYMRNIDQNDNGAVEKRMIEFISDAWFNVGALETAKSCVKYGNTVYLGSFDYYNQDSKDPYADWFPFKAANHNSELKYMLGEGMGKFDPIEEEFKVIDLMGTLAANFVKFGNPNGSETQTGAELWEPYTTSKPYGYFKIDYPKCEMRDDFQSGRLKILEEINENGKKYQEMVYGKK